MAGKGGVCGRGCAWQGVCMAGGMCDGGACVVGGGTCMAETMRYGQ